jgi:hypothetical protein
MYSLSWQAVSFLMVFGKLPAGTKKQRPVRPDAVENYH